MDSFGILPFPPRGVEIERTPLCCSFHAPTLHQGAALAGELRAIAAGAPRIRAVIVDSSPRRDWIVTFVTPLIPLTLAVLRRWEAELLEVEQRFAGCRFLGWRTGPAGSPEGEDQVRDGAGAATDAPPAQRQLVRASLLRHPSVVREEGARRRPKSEVSALIPRRAYHLRRVMRRPARGFTMCKSVALWPAAAVPNTCAG